MKFKLLATALLLALASGGVQAASTLSGPVGPLSNGQSAIVFNSPGLINDIWELDVSESTGAGNISISFTDIPFDPILNISGMSVMGSPDPAFTGSGDVWIFSGILPNGDYTITVSGIADGIEGGDYNVGFSAAPAAAPVPIPPAALLFGSALIGLAGLRRRKAAHEA